MTRRTRTSRSDGDRLLLKILALYQLTFLWREYGSRFITNIAIEFWDFFSLSSCFYCCSIDCRNFGYCTIFLSNIRFYTSTGSLLQHVRVLFSKYHKNSVADGLCPGPRWKSWPLGSFAEGDLREGSENNENWRTMRKDCSVRNFWLGKLATLSTARFPMSPSYVVPKLPPKGGSKTQSVQNLNNKLL